MGGFDSQNRVFNPGGEIGQTHRSFGNSRLSCLSFVTRLTPLGDNAGVNDDHALPSRL
jgi:hypothetical protein